MSARPYRFLSAVAFVFAFALAACSASNPSSGGGSNGYEATSGGSGNQSGAGAETGSSSRTSGSNAQSSGSPAGSSAALGAPSASGGASSAGPGSSRASSSSGSSIASGADAGSASSDTDGGAGVDCTATLPEGGTTFMGSSVNGNGGADGLNYGIWATGTGGSITIFPNAHAFSASWDNVTDFLAHVGLDFNNPVPYTSYAAITAQFVESKSGSAGTYSSIGMYGWLHSPCVEWYINEDSYSTYPPFGSTTVMIDGAEYYVSTSMTSGTGGANACETGHMGDWTNMTSTRKTPRQCGTIDVAAHFAAWAAQGWSLGSVASVHVNVEVGGGTGSIQFPVANVTATSN